MGFYSHYKPDGYGDPQVPVVRIPRQNYSGLYLLCLADTDPARTPVVSFRLGLHDGHGILYDTAVEVPRWNEAGNERVVAHRPLRLTGAERRGGGPPLRGEGAPALRGHPGHRRAGGPPGPGADQGAARGGAQPRPGALPRARPGTAQRRARAGPHPDGGAGADAGLLGRGGQRLRGPAAGLLRGPAEPHGPGAAGPGGGGGHRLLRGRDPNAGKPRPGAAGRRHPAPGAAPGEARLVRGRLPPPRRRGGLRRAPDHLRPAARGPPPGDRARTRPSAPGASAWATAAPPWTRPGR